MTAALEGGEWSASHPGRTLPPGKTRYPFYRRLGGPQGRSRRAENLVPTDKIYRRNKKIVVPHNIQIADKSLARPGRKQANVSVRMASISFGALSRRKKKLDDSSRLDVVEIARVPDMLPSLFPSWQG